jgi:hypothetical protein
MALEDERYPTKMACNRFERWKPELGGSNGIANLYATASCYEILS